MTERNQAEPRAPTERPDADMASQKPEHREERPGFDLGGSDEEQPSGPTSGTTIPGGPRSNVQGGSPKVGRAGGRSDLSGDRTPGRGGSQRI